MRQRVWILILVAATAATRAEAGEYWSSCNSCSASQSQQEAMLAVPPRTLGRHSSYVADFDRETVQKYTVWWDYDLEHRAWKSRVWAVGTESYVQYEFAQVVGAMKADVASLESGKVIPDSVAGSAFDVIHNSVKQQQVADYIIANMTFWELIGAPVFIPMSLLGKVIDLNLTIPVTFADGSTAKFLLTGIDGSLSRLEYVFELADGSARDADGNVIPATDNEAAPYVGEFSTHNGAQRMVDFIQGTYLVPTGSFVTCWSKMLCNTVTVTCKRN